jgi:dihydrofolate reductase
MNPILIVAVDRNNGIGKEGKLPWHVPEDLKYFKRETVGATVIMGRVTYESIGACLPKRENIVISRNGRIASRVPTVSSLAQAFERAKINGTDRVFVIGGKQIYEQALPFCNTIMMTRIPGRYDCDTFFPELNFEQDWKRVSLRREHAESIDGWVEYSIYQRLEFVEFELEAASAPEVFTHRPEPIFRLPKRCEIA